MELVPEVITKHLSENELEPHSPACPLCDSENRVAVERLQSNPDVGLMHCQSCHAATASRLPTKTSLDSYYQSYFEHDFQQYRNERYYAKLTHRILKTIRPFIKDKKHLAILDFGGGDGSTAVHLARTLLSLGIQSIDILIVEYTDQLVAVDDSRIRLKQVDTYDKVDQAKFDIIIASAIFEHIPKPKQDILSLFQLLNSGGFFYIRTPYKLPFVKLFAALGKKWDFSFPGHLHDLGPDFWNHYFDLLPISPQYKIMDSRPSYVETSFKQNSLIALISHILKAPWYILGNRYKYVGSWEICVQKIE